ncbi:hypothetical protein DERP_008798 [Dermatophagoides pteronyssinus]|uniref:Uncharacterized protein n=1 Tax=Dermatophagoides pteronyssinus TaxID=6956 RepID=A0ABQ8IWE6_DERPT|nr:hypothetical protein DERP_008798 [Dermatophagoides pteronyssinus]
MLIGVLKTFDILLNFLFRRKQIKVLFLIYSKTQNKKNLVGVDTSNKRSSVIILSIGFKVESFGGSIKSSTGKANNTNNSFRVNSPGLVRLTNDHNLARTSLDRLDFRSISNEYR